MARKITKKAVKNRLDKLFSEVIRSGGRCVKCGKTDMEAQIHASHIYSRSHLSVRWDELNCKPLCASCHFYWHQNPTESYEWLVSSGVRTEEEMVELKRRKETIKKWTVDELLDLEQKLKDRLLER